MTHVAMIPVGSDLRTLHIAGFTPPSSLILYVPMARDPPPEYPIASPPRGAPSVYMEPLSVMIHSRLETPSTPSHIQEPSAFREPYPVANPLTAPMTLIYSPNLQPITGDNPIASTTQRLMPAEEEYLRMFCLTPPTMHDTPPVPHPPFLATSQP